MTDQVEATTIPLIPLILIINPKSGDGKASSFAQEHVLPTLTQNQITVSRTVTTDGPGRAGREVLDFLREHGDYDTISVIVCGGDGTTHEIINILCANASELLRPHRIMIALVPTGTANALYSSSFPAVASHTNCASYRLQSLNSMISGQIICTPNGLSITKTQILNGNREEAESIYSAVVTSAALHAVILHDSEILRSQIPDTSRFKVAAMNNITRWYDGRLILRAVGNDKIWFYDAKKRQLQSHHPTLGEVTMEGPFAYFLSTVNVDRLEPTFVITPLFTLSPPGEDTMDLLVVRPNRTPSGIKDSHEVFASKLLQMFDSAYNDGVHVNLFYGGSDLLEEDGNCNSVAYVEYFRCGEWEWIPEATDEPAHFICSDGTILYIPIGGAARASIFKSDKLKFLLCK